MAQWKKVIVSGSAAELLNITASSAIITTLQGTASYSTQATTAYTASYVQTSQTASYVLSSSYALSSSFAETSSYVQTSQTASYVLNAISASYALSSSFSQTASYVQTSQTASYVQTAQTASYVQTAQTASYVLNAVSSSYALSSSFAQTASNITPSITNNNDNRVLTATGGGTINGEGNLTFDGTTLTILGNEVVTGNLTVQGTASFQNITNLEVTDKFILLGSGSNGANDGGIVIQQGTQNIGELFGYENLITRWGFTSSFDAGNNSFTPSAYITTTEFAASNPPALPIYGGAGFGFGNIYVNTSTGDIYIYA